MQKLTQLKLCKCRYWFSEIDKASVSPFTLKPKLYLIFDTDLTVLGKQLINPFLYIFIRVCYQLKYSNYFICGSFHWIFLILTYYIPNV